MGRTRKSAKISSRVAEYLDFHRGSSIIDSVFRIISRVADVIFSPFVFLSALVLRFLRRAGVSRFPLSKKVLMRVGVFPIRNHYSEPLFDARELKKPLSADRALAGIDWNAGGQLELLDCFDSVDELRGLPMSGSGEMDFYLNNGFFEAGDAEYWYHLIRSIRPKTIIEVGSGYSTLMAIKALGKNSEEDDGYRCDHYCIEPYERPWLEKSGVTVVREKIEDVDMSIFDKLGEGDVLFIDSSHIIRPQGDVTFEYLELLPVLSKGAIVHVHDIFSPKDYPEYWVRDQVYFYNEQYLLEAFMTSNKDWKIIGALNFLKNNYYEKLKEKCIHLTPEREPGSFYIQKTR